MSKCDTPFWVLPKAAFEKVPVPCGRCPPCKQRRVNSWVFRLQQEYKRATAAHFVTITYNTDNVPISKNGFMTLCKRDMQLYLKRLRKLQTEQIKYYLVGEYGTKNKRPHYHVIFFNVKNTQYFQDAWEKGDIHIGGVTSASMAYCMKYIDKPQSKKHVRDDRVPEFPLMSKKLGDNYIDEKIEAYHKADIKRLYVTNEGGYKLALPKYYRQKLYTEQEQRQQRLYVQAEFDKRTESDKREFALLYPNSKNFTFDDWQDLQKLGRHEIFYKNQKIRQ